MSNKWGVKPEQAKVLEELEKWMGKSIPLVDAIDSKTDITYVGVKIEEDNIIELGLHNLLLLQERFTLRELDLSLNYFSSLPESIGKLTSLQTLDLSLNNFSSLPESIGKLTSLQILDLERNRLTSLPESIGNLQSLRIVRLNDNKLTKLPESITELRSLAYLSLDENLVTTPPESIGNLKSLQILVLSGNQLTLLPESIGNLRSLQKLNLGNNRLKSIPVSIGNLTSLQTLKLERNELNLLPESIGDLQSLQELDLGINQLAALPESIGGLQSLQVLELIGNKLTALPESIGNLKSLQKLKLMANQLITLPESIGNLQSLQKLILQSNKISSLPESIGNLRSLQKLILLDNQLTLLPESIGNLQSLQKLSLTLNKLTSLPVSMWKLENLKILTLKKNIWENEWREMAQRDIPSILEFCKQKASINIFISHTVNEFALYRIKELAEYLEHQSEINQVYFCEEDLKGNIDAWMEETVPKSQLLLFIGTKQSKLSKDCWEERRLALKNDIPIIPIKGIDVDWKDLTSIGLSRELGFEYDEKNFEKLCADLVKYIHGFKRERDLLGKEQDKIYDGKLRISSLFKEHITSEDLNKIFSDNFSEIEFLEREFKSKKIKFTEFLRRFIDIFD